MRKEAESSLRKVLLLATTAAVAIGAMVGLPLKRAVAGTLQSTPAPGVTRPSVRLDVIQPRFVSPSAVNLLRLSDGALSDNALMERIFRDPASVAAEFNLSPSELLVLRHMDRAQFATARADAIRLVASRRASGRPMPPGGADVRLITARMIVGRAILAAVGRSYLEAASANACCPWSKAIEVGVGADPAAYNDGFARPSGLR